MVRMAAASISDGMAGTSICTRYLLSTRCMKKLPPTKTCFASSSRVPPNTRVIAVSFTEGMWQFWQLFDSL